MSQNEQTDTEPSGEISPESPIRVLWKYFYIATLINYIYRTKEITMQDELIKAIVDRKTVLVDGIPMDRRVHISKEPTTFDDLEILIAGIDENSTITSDQRMYLELELHTSRIASDQRYSKLDNMLSGIIGNDG